MKKISILLLFSFIITGCDPVKNLTIKNKADEPLYVLLKHQKGRNILNNWGHDTLIPFGTFKTSKSWKQFYSVGKWNRSEIDKITKEINNSLYFEMYDADKQRFQNPNIRVKRKLFDKSSVIISLKKY